MNPPQICERQRTNAHHCGETLKSLPEWLAASTTRSMSACLRRQTVSYLLQAVSLPSPMPPGGMALSLASLTPPPHHEFHDHDRQTCNVSRGLCKERACCSHGFTPPKPAWDIVEVLQLPWRIEQRRLSGLQPRKKANLQSTGQSPRLMRLRGWGRGEAFSRTCREGGSGRLLVRHLEQSWVPTHAKGVRDRAEIRHPVGDRAGTRTENAEQRWGEARAVGVKVWGILAIAQQEEVVTPRVWWPLFSSTGPASNCDKSTLRIDGCVHPPRALRFAGFGELARGPADVSFGFARGHLQATGEILTDNQGRRFEQVVGENPMPWSVDPYGAKRRWGRGLKKSSSRMLAVLPFRGKGIHDGGLVGTICSDPDREL
ncbi:hypothetical protein EDB92DRAFT_2101090 [Lactarius akahatsu]|uniref:Uncharacterized protein n=1 Tax=Lactarius akahatsu TaxID=416441 RepID=A0AAD4LQC1_9AGAM|nr:hypothetical protein EDB92DRAFT_2101090 [Lactarius akahatsu]